MYTFATKCILKRSTLIAKRKSLGRPHTNAVQPGSSHHTHSDCLLLWQVMATAYRQQEEGKYYKKQQSNAGNGKGSMDSYNSSKKNWHSVLQYGGQWHQVQSGGIANRCHCSAISCSPQATINQAEKEMATIIATGAEEQAQGQQQEQLHCGTLVAALSAAIAIQQAVTANATSRHETIPNEQSDRQMASSEGNNQWQWHGSIL